VLAALIAAAPPARAEPARWTTGLRPRVDVGAGVGVFYPDRLSWGFQIAGEVQLSTWRYGETGVGGLFSVQLLPVDLDGLADSVSGLDGSIGIAPTFGHTLRFVGRRLAVSTQLFTGLRIRTTRSSAEYRARDISVSHESAGVFWEAGVVAWIGWRFTDHLGVRVGAAMPVILSKHHQLNIIWQYSSRWVGLSGSYYF
jgi:hypothetical protein